MSRIRRFAKLLFALLREIADESAYLRHLESRRRVHSTQEWQRFYERRLAAKYARPKCC
jgi:hypothetical protein